MCACVFSLSFFVTRLNSSSSTIADEGKNTLVSFWLLCLELAELCWHHGLLLKAAANRTASGFHTNHIWLLMTPELKLPRCPSLRKCLHIDKRLLSY